MDYCLYHSIKTPDGTVLHCKDGHDYQSYKDTITNETYMIDGIGLGTRSSVNKVLPEDLSVWTFSPFEKVRAVKFWGSTGKDGNTPRYNMSMEEMEKSHIEAILRTQKQIKGSEIEKIFIKELEYRIEIFKNHLDTVVPPTNTDKKKKKI